MTLIEHPLCIAQVCFLYLGLLILHWQIFFSYRSYYNQFHCFFWLADKRKISEKDNKWVELAFNKRECHRYVPSTKDVARCACGQTWAFHKTHGVESVGEPGEVWGPSRHTISSPTDAYGTIDFLGGPHPNKAQFIRLSFDSRSDLILQLLTKEWGLELPKLIISVHGGKANFDLSTRLKKVLRHGLLRAAKTTGKVSLLAFSTS